MNPELGGYLIQPHGSAPRWRIGTVLLWLVLACLLPGILGVAVFFSREYLNGRAQLERDKIATARAMVQAVDSQLARVRTAAQALSTSGALSRQDLAGFHRRARNFIVETKVGLNVVLSDENGQQLVNTLREFGEPLPRHGNPDLLRRVFATGQPAISEIYIGGLLRKPVMSIDLPVMENGKVVYDLSIGLMPSDFNGILAAQNFPSAWVSAIFDSTGTIVARTHAPEKFVGQQGTAEYIQRIKNSPEGSMETVTREGIPALSFWSRSPVTGWSVGIGIPRETLESDLMLTLTWLASGMAIMLVVGLGLAWFAGRKIAASVRALTVSAVALGKGESVPIPEVAIQESAEVAAAIRQAAELLAARDAELREVHRVAGFGVWQWNLKTGEILVSESIRELYGREIPSFQEQRGTLLPIESWERLQAAMREVVRTGVGYDLEMQVNHGNGSIIWIHTKCEAIQDASGEVCWLHGSVLDITRRKQAELELEQSRQTHLRELEQEVSERTAALVTANQELERLARVDGLTGLQNRKSANERLRQEFLRLKRSGSHYAVLFMDIDHFKEINDTYGHETGDQVLRHFASVLEDSLRETDFVARYGGEEFLAILSDTSAEGALTIAEKIRSTVANQTVPMARRVTVSIGVAMALGEDKNEEEAVRRADSALYQAKEAGRNLVRSC